MLTEELAEYSEGQYEAQNMKLVQGHWKKKKKLELTPLPMELKYAYLEEQEQCAVVISSLLHTSQEGSFLHILKKNKQALGWKITDLKGINPVVCTYHIYLEEEAKSVRQP